jgi:DNA-directed RNA polymerase subunit M
MDINFCECGGAMVPAGENKLKCRTCGKIVDRKVSAAKIVTRNEKKEVLVFENNDPDLPTMEKECESCGNNRAFFFIKQTRASDEPPTRFFRCTKCKHTWREYQ